MDQVQFQDLTLYDQETGEAFTFTAKEQEFFARQGFTHVPKHSPERRKMMREQRYKGKPVFNVRCMVCGKVGKVTQEPPYPRQILCEFCFNEKWEAWMAAHPEKLAAYEQALAESMPPPALESLSFDGYADEAVMMAADAPVEDDTQYAEDYGNEQ